MKILVTGATGFVGRHVMRIGESLGHQMHRIDRTAVEFTGEVDVIAERVRALVSETDPDAIIHLVGPPPDGSEELCAKICGAGTEGLLRGIASSGISPKVVGAGSSMAVGVSDHEVPCVTEETPAEPRTPYGKWKLRQTELFLEAGGVSLRLFNAIGPGQKPSLVAGRIAEQLARGVARIQLRETRSKRDFLDVRDAASAFLLAAESIPPGLYNLSSGKMTGISELVEIACRAVGIDPLPIDVEFPDQPASFQCGNPSKLESFGWMRRHSIEDSMRDAVAELRRSG